jgi:hypothetical protein
LRGQKRPLKPKEVWAIRVRLEIAGAKRNLALFNLAIDSKLRACDLVTLKVEDLCLGRRVRDRAMIIQRRRAGQFSLSSPSQPVFPFRTGSTPWSYAADMFFPSRHHDSPHLSTRPYARIVDGWVKCAGLDPAPAERIPCAGPRQRKSIGRPAISAPSNSCLVIRSWKAWGCYLGVEVDDTLAISEQIEL